MKNWLSSGSFFPKGLSDFSGKIDVITCFDPFLAQLVLTLIYFDALFQRAFLVRPI
eukprot:UN12824